uniref:DUF6985 domain-containing protein n=1 Tax=Thaumasiovibrio occultus TaxID=1891184 RepID=UPI001864B5F2|nr:hypothetical protein [Thaumasiovibrio occultus]
MKNNNIEWAKQPSHSHGVSDLTAWRDFSAFGNIKFHHEESENDVENMLDWLHLHEQSIYSLTVEYFTEHYVELLDRSEFLDVFEEEHTYPTNVGDVTKADMLEGNIFQLIQVSRFVLHQPATQCIGIIFECAWDEEHGLGLVIHNDQVVFCGGESEAYYNQDELKQLHHI